jgi:plastocyanin
MMTAKRHPLVLTTLLLLLSAPEGRTQFVTLKGQIVYGEEKFPTPKEITPNTNQEHCLSKGKLFTEVWVIDKDSKGVKWVFVWLLDRKGKSLPPNPNLPAPSEKVVMDQPCCAFVPRVVALRAGQVLEVRNSAPINHNVNWSGGGRTQPSGNVGLRPSDGKQEITGLKPTTLGAVLIGCNIHGWMKGWVRVFDHPYYAVTDQREVRDKGRARASGTSSSGTRTPAGAPGIQRGRKSRSPSRPTQTMTSASSPSSRRRTDWLNSFQSLHPFPYRPGPGPREMTWLNPLLENG